MLRDRLRLGVWIGIVAAAATAGALVGFGWVRGTPLQPLNMVGHVLLGSRAYYVADMHPLVTTAAVFVHAASLVAWGILFSLALRQGRGAQLWAAAFAFAAIVAVVDFLVLPDRFSPGFETVLTRGELVVVYGVMAVAMAVGAGWGRQDFGLRIAD